jgi:hypothetical protein
MVRSPCLLGRISPMRFARVLVKLPFGEIRLGLAGLAVTITIADEECQIPAAASR